MVTQEKLDKINGMMSLLESMIMSFQQAFGALKHEHSTITANAVIPGTPLPSLPEVQNPPVSGVVGITGGGIPGSAQQRIQELADQAKQNMQKG